MFLTADDGPQVKSHGALQRLIRSAKGVEEEEAGGHRGEEDHSTTEEDDGDMEACWDGAQQVWEDWERNRGGVKGEWIHRELPVPGENSSNHRHRAAQVHAGPSPAWTADTLRRSYRNLPGL